PGGTMTTRSTPASSIIGSARSMVNGSGNCGLTPGSQGQSGELAFQKCTWASTIVRLLAGCGRVCCALVASAGPATSVVPMNLRRVSIMVLPDGAALWQRFVVGILQPGHGKAQSRLLTHGRDVRQRLRASGRGDRERAQLASPDILDRCGRAGEVDLHLSTEQIIDRRPATTIGHVHEVHP